MLYRRRRCSVARTVSHNKYDYRCRIAVQMSHRTPRYHRRRVRTAAVDPRWYRSRCCYRCTAAGTAGYHSRCRRCDRCMTGATLVNRSRCHRGRYRSSAVGRKGLGRRNICDRADVAMTAQMLTLTTGAAYSVEPPWPSRRAHLRLVPGSSASLARDSRSRAAVMWPQLLWLPDKTNAAVVDDCAAEVVVVDLHQRAAVVAYNGPSS